MSRVTRDYPRQPDEEYNTPDWVGSVIAAWLKREGVRRILDPAPGSGQFAQGLRHLGFNIESPLGDFLKSTTWQLFDCDALVTNPPYGKRGELAEAFIRHAVHKLEAPIAAFLLRADYDSAKTRRNLFADCPFFAGKIVLLDRIVWFEREGMASPSENHAWFIWIHKDEQYFKRARPWISYGLKNGDL